MERKETYRYLSITKGEEHLVMYHCGSGGGATMWINLPKEAGEDERKNLIFH